MADQRTTVARPIHGCPYWMLPGCRRMAITIGSPPSPMKSSAGQRRIRAPIGIRFRRCRIGLLVERAVPATLHRAVLRRRERRSLDGDRTRMPPGSCRRAGQGFFGEKRRGTGRRRVRGFGRGRPAAGAAASGQGRAQGAAPCQPAPAPRQAVTLSGERELAGVSSGVAGAERGMHGAGQRQIA